MAFVALPRPTASSSWSRPLMRLLLLIFLASPALLHASQRPAKRTYDTHEYYVIHHNPLHGHSPEDSAAALGAELVEQVGELKDHYLIRTPKSQDDAIASRDSKNPVVTSFGQLKRRSDPLAYSVRSLHPQVLKKRVKRAPIPTFPSLNDVVSSLGIHDPTFSDQWHIVNKEHPEYVIPFTLLCALTTS
jgi:kexin